MNERADVHNFFFFAHGCSVDECMHISTRVLVAGPEDACHSSVEELKMSG